MKELCPFPRRASTRDSGPIFIARSLVQQRHALLGVAGRPVCDGADTALRDRHGSQSTTVPAGARGQGPL